GLRAAIFGVRYPASALNDLHAAGIGYGGLVWDYEGSRQFSGFKLTGYGPPGIYFRAVPWVPPIRVFEALACGIPLVSAPWEDVEQLFDAGSDFLMARDGRDMKRKLRLILRDPVLAAELSARGLQTIQSRHTCAHRVNELLRI